ncbi:MAG: flagellar biosynthesis anti-sigma factor FlgM [Chloroflexi bacterium]|nr:flagellar biosynthesis anti-sigma factor FlgM [Chloroflexota bacterium]
MKIENNNLLPLSAKPTEVTPPVEKKDDHNGVSSVRSGQDRVEMSENARLLAKARTALGNVDETDSQRLLMLKNQIASGDYTIQVSELARKLMATLFPK